MKLRFSYLCPTPFASLMNNSALLLISLTGTSALAAAQDAGSRPNVILLLADDLGFGDLSCYGATRIATPHTDSVAAAGVRFTDAHAVAATSTINTPCVGLGAGGRAGRTGFPGPGAPPPLAVSAG